MQTYYHHAIWFFMLLPWPDFLIYVAASLSIVAVLILHLEPRYGLSNILVYLGICSLMGSLTVIKFGWYFELHDLSIMFSSPQFLLWVIMASFLQVVSIKAIGIAIKLTLEGTNQLIYAETWFFMTVGAICVITQLNYLNKVCIFFYCMFFNPCFFLFPSFSMFLMRGVSALVCILVPFFLPMLVMFILVRKLLCMERILVFSVYCITSLAFPWVSLFSKRTFQWRYIFWFSPLCIIKVILF